MEQDLKDLKFKAIDGFEGAYFIVE